MCIACLCTDTHTFISLVAFSLSVILWFEVIYIYVFVCLYVCFFSACLLSGAPVGAKAGFPKEADFLMTCKS